MITSLTFQDNNAEQAMNLYVEVFENSRVLDVKRWGAAGAGIEGKIMQARFELNGNLFMVSDSPAVHKWGFTPAITTFIECESEKELERLFSQLSKDGKVMMEPADYGFSKKFAWFADKFGVTWQLNLE